MPLQQCEKDGKSGWKYGEGTCYTGENAKKRAERQGRAIQARDNTSKSGAYSGVGEKAVANRKKYKGMLKEAGE